MASCMSPPLRSLMHLREAVWIPGHSGYLRDCGSKCQAGASLAAQGLGRRSSSASNSPFTREHDLASPGECQKPHYHHWYPTVLSILFQDAALAPLCPQGPRSLTQPKQCNSSVGNAHYSQAHMALGRLTLLDMTREQLAVAPHR